MSSMLTPIKNATGENILPKIHCSVMLSGKFQPMQIVQATPYR